MRYTPGAPALRRDVFGLRCELCEAIEECKRIHEDIVGRYPQNEMQYTPPVPMNDPIDDPTLDEMRQSVYAEVFSSIDEATRPTITVWNRYVDVRTWGGPRVCLFSWSYPNGAEWFYRDLPSATIRALVGKCSRLQRKLYLHDFAYVQYTLMDDSMDDSQNSRGNNSILRLPFRLRNFKTENDSIDMGSYYYQFGFRSAQLGTDQKTQHSLRDSDEFISALSSVRSLASVPALARHSTTMQSLLLVSSAFPPALRLGDTDMITKWYRFHGTVPEQEDAQTTASLLCDRRVLPGERVEFRAFLHEWKPNYLMVSLTIEGEHIYIVTVLDFETFHRLEYDVD